MRLPALPGPGDVRAAAEQLLAVVPRMTSLLSEAEALLRDARALLDRIERTRTDADGLVREASATRDRAEGTLTVTNTVALRVFELLEQVEPGLRKATPTVNRLADVASPATVDAAVRLIEELGSVAPDLHQLLDASKQLNEMLGNLPGMGRIKKRVEEELESGAETEGQARGRAEAQAG